MSIAIILAALAVCIVAQAFSPYFLACADDDENNGTVDEHGIRRVPGEDPREVGLS